MTDQLYTRLSGKVRGPYSLTELHELASRGSFSKAHEVSVDRKSWTSASSRSDLFPVARKPQSGGRKTQTNETEGTASGGNANPADSKIRGQSPVPPDSPARPEHNSSSVDSGSNIRPTDVGVPAPAVSAHAVGVAVVGPVGFILLLVCTAMIVIRLRSSPSFMASQNVGLMTLLGVDFVLGCVAVTLGGFAIRLFQQRSGIVRERNLIVIGLSCGCTILILCLLYSVVLLISALG